jgi:apolipoprotein D and lipocalin family protein
MPIALAAWRAVIRCWAKSLLQWADAEGTSAATPTRGAAARWRLLLPLPLVAQLAAYADSLPPLRLASQVNLEAMQGGWYIVATIPNFFERGMVAPFDVYSQRTDGDMQENFYLRRGGFDAKVRHYTVRDSIVPGSNNARWRVHLFWPISVPFLVLYTDPAYRYVMFGENDRSLGWVFSRTPTIADADYHALLDRFAALGYDTTRFRKVIQLPEQIGMPGFWNDGIQ